MSYTFILRICVDRACGPGILVYVTRYSFFGGIYIEGLPTLSKWPEKINKFETGKKRPRKTYCY